MVHSIDNGGGMDPEAMRRCMSFGFSDKKNKSAIGQCMDHVHVCYKFYSFLLSYLWTKHSLSDGNGFKTSTMRLGADVIVFSRHLHERFVL